MRNSRRLKYYIVLQDSNVPLVRDMSVRMEEDFSHRETYCPGKLLML